MEKFKKLRILALASRLRYEYMRLIKGARLRMCDSDCGATAGYLNLFIDTLVEGMMPSRRIISPLFIISLSLTLVVDSSTCLTTESAISHSQLFNATKPGEAQRLDQIIEITQTPKTTTTTTSTTTTAATITTAEPQVSSVSPLPTTSYDTPFQPTELSESYENYLNSSYTTQTVADEQSISEKDSTGRYPYRSVEIENRIGLSALVDRPPEPLTSQPPTRLNTSPYSVIEDDGDESRNSLFLATTTGVEIEITTPVPPPPGATSKGSHQDSEISNKISNINDNLMTLASNANASGYNRDATVASKTRNSIGSDPDHYQPDSTSKRVMVSYRARPFSDTYFVPQTKSPPFAAGESQLTTSVLPVIEEPPSGQFHIGDGGGDGDGDDDQHKLIHDTIIPRTSVNDLLHIIKHLNLINTDNYSRHKKTKESQMHAKVLDSNRRLPLLSHVDMATLESSSSLGKSVDQTDNRLSLARQQKNEARINDIIRNDNITKTTTRRPDNITKLISPYSANFESALPLFKNIPINRASMATLKDQIQISMAANATNENNATYTSKHNTKTQHTIKIGSKPAHTGGSKVQGKTRLKVDLAVDSGGEPIKLHKSKSRIKVTPAPSSDKVVGDRPSHQALATDDSAESSPAKRGQRDAANKSNERDHPLATGGESPSEQPSKTSSSKDQQQRAKEQVSKQNGPSQDAQFPPANLFGIHSSSSPSTQLDPTILDTLKHKLAQAAAAVALGPVPSHTISNYLDDPHKKSYYWTSERANMYLDDDMGSYSRLPKLPGRPLTIGELARQQGIINDLRFNHHHHHNAGRNPVVEDFGLLSESGLHEHLEPFSNHDSLSPALVTVPPPATASASGDKIGQFKLDDDLKQKIAIKTFEAAARDPELFPAALFGSLLGLSGPETNEFVQQQQAASRPHAGLNPKSPLINMMTPLPTMQDNRVIHSSQLPVSFNGIGGQHAGTRPSVNLVVADLANKWALSRMPDLVPIPLAATVPGYLIRLPDGKILAAALTNMFSIQGIQREPMGNNYKNLINQKFKGLIKPNQSTSSGWLKQHNQGGFASLVADSGLIPTLALPAGAFNQHQGIIGTKGSSRFTYKVNPNKERGGGLFSGTRGVLGQLLASSSKTHHQRHVNNQSKGKKQHQQHNKLDGSISNTKMVELIKKLPFADPNEPVFSFADESELIDEPDTYQTAAASNVQFPHNSLGSGQLFSLHDHQLNMFSQQQQQNHHRALQNHQAHISDGASDLLLPLKDRLSHLVNLRNSATMASDDLFGYNKRKRKSPPKLSLTKPLEPILNWLKSNRASIDITRRNPRLCND